MKRGCYIETGDLSTGAGGGSSEVTATGTEVPAVVPEQNNASTEQSIQREDFVNAPFLRKLQTSRQEEPGGNKAGETQTAETKLDNPEQTAPAGEEEQLETPAETPTVVKLADGREVTPEQIANWEKGFMLQSDYTKKTQSLAEERRQLQKEIDSLTSYKEQADPALQLWQAIERDPIGTLQHLQQHYETQGVLEPKDPEILAREDHIRQLENDIRVREQRAKESMEQEALNRVNSQLDALATKHGDKFDREKTIQYMIDNRIPDPEKAHKAMTYDDGVSGLQAQMDVLRAEMDAKLKAAREEAVGEYIKTKTAKNDAPPPVGASSGGGSPPVQINAPKSFQDSRRAALARLAAG